MPLWSKKGLNDLVEDPTESPITVKPYSDWVDDMAASGTIQSKGGCDKGGVGKVGQDKKRCGFQEKAAALMVHYENSSWSEFQALAGRFEQSAGHMFKDILRKFRRNEFPSEM